MRYGARRMSERDPSSGAMPPTRSVNAPRVHAHRAGCSSAALGCLVLACAACGSREAARVEPVRAPEQRLVMSLSTVPGEDDCRSGGTRVACGVDRDGDDQLDEAEVEATREVCATSPAGDEPPPAQSGIAAGAGAQGYAANSGGSTAPSAGSQGVAMECPSYATLVSRGAPQIDDTCPSGFSSTLAIGRDLGDAERGAPDGELQPDELNASVKLCVAEPRATLLSVNAELFDSAAWYWRPDRSVTFQLGYAALCGSDCRPEQAQELYQPVTIPSGTRAYARIEYDAHYFARYCNVADHKLDFLLEEENSDAVLLQRRVQCPGRSPAIVDLSQFAGRTVRIKLRGAALPGPLLIQAFGVYSF